MPLYEYQCEKCDAVFEVIQKFSDEPLTTHAGCGGSVHRLLSSPALQFKGSGWYVTDYARGKNSNSGNGTSASPESKSESKAESKSESKPESKADSKSPAPSKS
ncbi:MAG: zinc ribbon domain-containing protein [Bryobacterales bacterium]|nr:zinc ribbon domain-containing protein [Bryobacterales bacterium]